MYQDGVIESQWQKLKNEDPDKYSALKSLDEKETYWKHENGHELVISNGEKAYHLDTRGQAHVFGASELTDAKHLVAAGYIPTDFATAEAMADMRMIELERPSVEGLKNHLMEKEASVAEQKFSQVAERMAQQIENDPEQQQRLDEWQNLEVKMDGQDPSETARQNTRAQALANYRAVYQETLDMRAEFAGKPGYVRQKSKDEKAYHSAKAAFGEFNPNDHAAMAANTNNGKGVEVQLTDGTVDKINNQKELFDRIVAFNKEHGKFYDEAHIKKTSEADHYRLQQNQLRLNEAKKAVVDSHKSKKDGYRALNAIEKAVRDENQAARRQNAKKSPPEAARQRGSRRRAANPNIDNELAYDGDIDESRIREPADGMLNKFTVIRKRNQQHYYWKDSDKMAFADRGKKITTQSNSKFIAQSIVEVADSKGWTQLKVKGQDSFRRTVWYEAALRGIEVDGYEPSEQDLKQLQGQLGKNNSVEAVKTMGPQNRTRADQAGEEKKERPAVPVEDRTRENYRLLNGLVPNKNMRLSVQTHGKREKTAAVLVKSGRTSEQYIFSLDTQNKAAVLKAYHRSENGRKVEITEDLDRRKNRPSEEKLRKFQIEATENSLRKLPQGDRQNNLAEIKEPGFAHTGNRKTELKKAYLTMGRREALARHPELKELYELESAANELAVKRIGNPQSRTEYVTAIRERSLTELANGNRLPQLAHGQAYGPEASRAAERQMDAER